MGAVLVPLSLLRLRSGPIVGPAGTAALTVGVLGAVWVGSAGWGSALTAACALGMILVAPLVLGWVELAPGRQRQALLAVHAAVALVVPRSVMQRSVPVAVALAVALSLVMGAVAVLVRHERGRC